MHKASTGAAKIGNHPAVGTNHKGTLASSLAKEGSAVHGATSKGKNVASAKASGKGGASGKTSGKSHADNSGGSAGSGKGGGNGGGNGGSNGGGSGGNGVGGDGGSSGDWSGWLWWDNGSSNATVDPVVVEQPVIVIPVPVYDPANDPNRRPSSNTGHDQDRQNGSAGTTQTGQGSGQTQNQRPPMSQRTPGKP